MPPVIALVAGIVVSALAATPIIGVIGIGGAIAIGNAVAIGAVAIGLSAAQFALSRTLTDRSAAGGPAGSAPARINAPEVRGSVKQATPIQRIVFGEIRCGGAMFFYDAKPPYLYVGLMHSTYPVSEYVTLYIGNKQVALDPSGNPASPPYATTGTQYLTVKTQTGASLAQAVNPLIAADYASLGADFRLPGIANTVAKYRYGADFDDFQAKWGNVQIPDLQWVIRGAPLYDPRDPSQVLPDDLRDIDALYAAFATWKWSNNAALAQAFWAMMPCGLNAGPARIRWDKVAEAADFDDEPVALKDGGFLKRHTVDGVVTLGDPPNSVMEAMLTANRGFVVQQGGKVSLYSSQPLKPRVGITAGHMTKGFEFRNARPKRDLVNVASCTFIAPDRAYQDATGPVLRRDDLIAADGEEFEQNVRLPFTLFHQRAQRLLKAFMSASRLGKRLASACDLRLLGIEAGNAVEVWHSVYRKLNGLYTVEDWSLDIERAELALNLAEYDPAIAIDWNAAEDEQDFELALDDVS